MDYCEKTGKYDADEFIKNLTLLCSKFDVEDFVYDPEIGISVFNSEFWALVREVNVAPEGIQITMEEFDGLTTQSIGHGPFEPLQKKPDESWIVSIGRHINTL